MWFFFVKNRQTNTLTVSTNGKMVTMQIIASLLADVEPGAVTRALLESDKLQRENGNLFLRQTRNGLPGLIHQQLQEIVLPLYGLNDRRALGKCLSLLPPVTHKAHEPPFACMSTTSSWEKILQHIKPPWMLRVQDSHSQNGNETQDNSAAV